MLLKDGDPQTVQLSRESETLYRSLFEFAPSGVVMVDDDGRILQFNEHAHRQLGYTREEFAGLRISDFADESHDEVRSRIARVFDVGGAEFEVRHRSKSGDLYDRTVSSRPVVIGGRNLLVSVWHDVTAHKQAEEALRDSEARYRALFDTHPVPKWLYDVETLRFLAVNHAAVRQYGYSREEFLAMTAKEIRPPEEVERLLERLPVLRSGNSGIAIWKHRKKNGTLIDVEVHGDTVETGGRRCRLVTAQDVTERLRMERTLLERVKLGSLAAEVGLALTRADTLREILQHCTAAIVRHLGAAFARIWTLNTGRNELELQASAGLYTHIDGPHGRVAVGKLKIGLIAQERLPHLTNDVLHDPRIGDPEWARREGMVAFAGHPLVVSGELVGVMAMFGRQPLSDLAANGLASVADAIAVGIQRKLAEAARASLEAQLRQAQKLESIGQLAGGIAHDFNNLLTVILSGAEALRLAGGEGSPPDPEIVEEIAGAGGRARDLTRQLLAFARRQVIAPVPLDLNAVVRGSEKLLRRVLGEDITLVANLQPALWSVRCDPGQIEQVILNLAVNARDAMPSGGTLILESSNFEVGEMYGELFPGMQPGPYVRLAVHDSGAGMSPEVKDHVFEPFFTTKPAGKGTGLGLATVYGIVTQSNGFIRVESEPTYGTTFEVLFPRIPDVAVPAEPPVLVTSRQGTETVLVVEDDPQVRAVTVRSLRAGGYVVVVANDGREALDVGAREGVPLHLLVTDVIMPGLDGRAVADELRRLHPKLRVLYVSGHAEEVIVKRGVLEPGIEFLAKPFTASSLLARVRAVLDAR